MAPLLHRAAITTEAESEVQEGRNLTDWKACWK